MPEIGTFGLMSGDGKRGVAECPCPLVGRLLGDNKRTLEGQDKLDP
jgi:hypothetical protein